MKLDCAFKSVKQGQIGLKFLTSVKVLLHDLVKYLA